MVNCGVPSSVLDEPDEAEMSRLIERMRRRHRLAFVGAYASILIAGGSVYYEYGSLTLGFLTMLGTYFLLAIPIFGVEFHVEYVTDAPVDAVRSSFTGETPPVLYSSWHDAEDIVTHEEVVEYDQSADDPSRSFFYRLTERTEESISGLSYSREERIRTWTVRFADEVDGTRLFFSGNLIGGKSIVSLVALYLNGSVETDAMALMGYEFVDGSTNIGLYRGSSE